MIEQVTSREVYRNAWMTVREDEIRLADGTTGIYGVVDKNDFAMVLPYENDGFHLVEQYRYPVAGRHWEFPQGGWPAGSMGAAAELARAELAEETGYRAGSLAPLGRLYAAYGFAGQAYDVFLATDLTPGPTAREPSEQDMRQRWVARTELEDMIRTGAFQDSHSVAAYGLWRLAGPAG